MTAEEAKQDILNWLKDFVEKPNSLLNGWPPCPYAKEARLKNRVHIHIGTQASLHSDLVNFVGKIQKSEFEVIILALLPGDLMSVAATKKLVANFRQQWAPQDIYLLKDHPEDTEITNSVRMNQGTYQLFFLQKLSSLEKASADLQKNGYYHSWDPEYLKRVVQTRQEFLSVAVDP